MLLGHIHPCPHCYLWVNQLKKVLSQIIALCSNTPRMNFADFPHVKEQGATQGLSVKGAQHLQCSLLSRGVGTLRIHPTTPKPSWQHPTSTRRATRWGCCPSKGDLSSERSYLPCSPSPVSSSRSDRHEGLPRLCLSFSGRAGRPCPQPGAVKDRLACHHSSCPAVTALPAQDGSSDKLWHLGKLGRNCWCPFGHHGRAVDQEKHLSKDPSRFCI